MYCDFCGKNFDRTEGFEEVTRSGHHLIRCEKCVHEKKDDEYDWQVMTYGRARRTPPRKA